MGRRLRIQALLVQPVLVWDDGHELAAGPELGQISLPLSALADFAGTLPAEVAALQAQLDNQPTEQEPPL